MELTQQRAANGLPAELHHLRTAAGLSQRALARASGLTAAYVSLLEAGRRTPERGTLERLAHALGLADAERDRLLRAAGYAPSGPREDGSVGPLAAIERLLADCAFTTAQEALVVRLLSEYAATLVAQIPSGQGPALAAGEPWPLRVLAVIQDAIDAAQHAPEQVLPNLGLADSARPAVTTGAAEARRPPAAESH